MKRVLVPAAAAVFILCILVQALTGCSRGPFRFGFVGGLTGKMSDLGISGRNSLQLAIETINEAGGIDGRRVSLITADDKNDPEAAGQAVRDLISRDADIIIGHMVSSMTLHTVPIVNKHRILMVSPTTSTPLLSGKDDYFLRVIPENTGRIADMVDYITRHRDCHRFAGVIDTANESYTGPWWESFTGLYASAERKLVHEQFYSSTGEVDYAGIISQAAAATPDCIVITANAFDTAMFCQQIEKQGIPAHIVASGWAMTEDLIRYGGKAVEGLIFSATPEPDSSAEDWLRFEEAYIGRYGEKPDFAAINTYDAAMIVRRAYSEKKRDEPLKDAIIRIRSFDSLQGTVTINRFGDAEKEYHIIAVKDGAFIRQRR